MKTRLQQFLAAENISQAQFADSIHVARAGVSHIIAGRNKPGYDFIINTMKRYPELNIEWLLSGKGKMYRDAREASPLFAPLTENPLPEPSGEINLFTSEQDISLPMSDEEENIAAPIDMNPLGETMQHAVKQRKASKIIIFFDDGTFQEFL